MKQELHNSKEANVVKCCLLSAASLRYQDELMRLKFFNRQQQARKFSLIKAAKLLQHRGNQSKSRLSIMLSKNTKEEKEKTAELEKVALKCKSLTSITLYLKGMCAIKK